MKTTLAVVLDLARRHAPNVPGAHALTHETDLVSEHGYDSVRLVELLIGCEEALGVSVQVEDLLSQRAITPLVIASMLRAVGAR